MKNRYKLIAFILAFAIILAGSGGAAYAYTPVYSSQAKTLNALGLLSGDANGNLLLEKGLNRAEMAVMLVRLLGKTGEALAGSYSHPFDDVRKEAAWADKYVGYLYENKLVAGKSADVYGAKDPTTFQQYTAVVLRALGYSEAAGDYTYKAAGDAAINYKLLTFPQSLDVPKHPVFYRDDMAVISYNALFVKNKGKDTILLHQLAPLISDKMFASAALIDKNIADFINGEYDRPLSAEDRLALVGAAVFRLEFKDAEGKVIGAGHGFLVSEDGTAVTCCHLFYGAISAEARFSDGTISKITAVTGYDTAYDLAVIKLASPPAACLKFGALSTIAKDDTVGIGYLPQSNKHDIKEDKVVSTAQYSFGDYILPCIALQTNLPEYSDGAPVLNKRGRVVGIANTTLYSQPNPRGSIQKSDIKNMALPSGRFAAIAADKTLSVAEFGQIASATRPVERGTIPEQDQGNSSSGAQLIQSGDQVSGILSGSGDIDYYAFNCLRKGTFTASVFPTTYEWNNYGTRTLFDMNKTLLQLCKPDGTVLAAGTKNTSGALSLTYANLPEGSYLLRLSAASGTTFSTYVGYSLYINIR